MNRLSQEIAGSRTQADLDVRDVLAVLINRHGEKWLRFVRRMLRNSADAEDVLQEAVRRVLTTRRSFASEDQVRMYLSRAIGNTAIEFYHTRRRESLRQLPLQEHVIAYADSMNPQAYLEQIECAAERAQALKLLQAGLGSLPAKQYEALCMTVLDPGEASIREAGSENGIPYSTLRHRSVQGIRRLRNYLHRATRVAELKFLPV
jgi:RNA polymerase sigma factor (sigma-70 family)